MSRRTLTRRLQSEGRRFCDLLAEVRRRQAITLLAMHSVETVTQALGYSEPRSFSRAFQRWTEMTPSRWKLEHVLV